MDHSHVTSYDRISQNAGWEVVVAWCVDGRGRRLPSADANVPGTGWILHPWPQWNVYPLVMTNIAIEHGHRNSGFSHLKWWFSIVMLVYQRVYNPSICYKCAIYYIHNWSRAKKPATCSHRQVQWFMLFETTQLFTAHWHPMFGRRSHMFQQEFPGTSWARHGVLSPGPSNGQMLSGHVTVPWK